MRLTPYKSAKLKKTDAVVYCIDGDRPWSLPYEVIAKIYHGELIWAEDCNKRRKLVGATAFFSLASANAERAKRMRKIMTEGMNRYNYFRKEMARKGLDGLNDPPKQFVRPYFR